MKKDKNEESSPQITLDRERWGKAIVLTIAFFGLIAIVLGG